MPAVPTLGVKLHTNTQYGRNQLASRIGVHNLSIYLISLLSDPFLMEKKVDKKWYEWYEN